MMNRLLLLQSYSPTLQIDGESDCDDVRLMRQAVARLGTGEDLHVGAAGTVLRFMALRASRLTGRHRLTGEPRLFSRPQEELLKVLRQLGVSAELTRESLEIEGTGWHLQGDTLLVPRERSSQFVSSVLLNSWCLPQDLFVATTGQQVSEGYFRMTVRLVEQAGMKVEFGDREFRVSKNQMVQASRMTAEMDISSAFALAGLAAVNGQATFLDFPTASLQPDVAFVSILEKMGVPLQQSSQTLKVGQAHRLRGVRAELTSNPDLFPVLAILCALAEGESELIGAPHLVHKESNRLATLAKWSQSLGRDVRVSNDGLKIFGAPLSRAQLERLPPLHWDCDQDHRLVFAAAVARSAGAPIEIQQKDAVSKSFPEFWHILGWAS